MNQYNQAREILNNLTARLKESPAFKKTQKLVVIFDERNNNLEAEIQFLRKIIKYGHIYDLAFSKRAEEVGIIEKIKSQLQPQKVFTEENPFPTDYALEDILEVIIPSLSQNTAIKLSLGIHDDYITRFLWHSLWKGKTISANLEDLTLLGGRESKNPFLHQLMEGYIQQLKRMGFCQFQKEKYLLEKKVCKEISSTQSNVESKTQTGFRLVITEKDILRYYSTAKEILVPKGTIVTPLAYDRAKAQGIKIVKTEEVSSKERLKCT